MEKPSIKRLVVKKENARELYVDVVSAEEVAECIWRRWLELGGLQPTKNKRGVLSIDMRRDANWSNIWWRILSYGEANSTSRKTRAQKSF